MLLTLNFNSRQKLYYQLVGEAILFRNEINTYNNIQIIINNYIIYVHDITSITLNYHTDMLL